MSLWNCKRSGWINLSLTLFLVGAVMTSICSTGIRSGFKSLSLNYSFRGGPYPEIGLFNFLLFCSAIFGFVAVALRYSYIMDQNQIMPTSINYINKISVFMGMMSFFGLIIIASFSAPVIEKASAFQTTGAYIFIGVGALFTIFQTVLTYTSSRYSLMFITRIFLAALLISSFLSSIIFIEKSKIENASQSNDSISYDITISFVESTGALSVKEEVIKANLLTAYILEWISIIVYALFYLSFFQEFQTISAYVIMRPFINYPSNDFRSSSLTVNERV